MDLTTIDNYLLERLAESKIFVSVILTILFIQIKEYSNKNLYLTAIFHIIGTVFHEFSHYCVALILTLRFPKWISILPSSETVKGKEFYNLGYVEINSSTLNTFNAALIAFAPLSLLYGAYFVSEHFFEYYTIWFEVSFASWMIYLFLIITLLINAIPSVADFELSKRKGSLYFWIAIIITCCLINFTNILEI